MDPNLDRLARQWVEHLIKAVSTGVENNKPEVTLAGHFNVAYLREDWHDVLDEARRLCERKEMYEHCITIGKLQEQISAQKLLSAE